MSEIELTERENADGFTMVVSFRDEDLAVVEYVDQKYAATMRGALMLIGGMRAAEELE